MATFTKPTKTFRWASVGAVTSEPLTTEKDTGWVIAQKPPAQYMNWIQNGSYQWFAWLNERVFDGSSSDDLVLRTPNVPSDILTITSAGTVRVENSTTKAPLLSIEGDLSADLGLQDSGASVDEKKFRLRSDNGIFSISALSDAGAVLTTPIQYDRTAATLDLRGAIITTAHTIQIEASIGAILVLKETVTGGDWKFAVSPTSTNFYLTYQKSATSHQAMRIIGDADPLTYGKFIFGRSATSGTPLSATQGQFNFQSFDTTSSMIHLERGATDTGNVITFNGGQPGLLGPDNVIQCLDNGGGLGGGSLIFRDTTGIDVMTIRMSQLDVMIFKDLIPGGAGTNKLGQASTGNVWDFAFLGQSYHTHTASEPSNNNGHTIRHRKNSIVAWATITANGASPTQEDSWGFDAVTAAIGNVTFTFNSSTAMADTNYAVVATMIAPQDTNPEKKFIFVNTTAGFVKTTTGFTIRTENDKGNALDVNFSVVVIGEPAP